MKEIIKRDWPYVLLLLILVLNCAVQCSLFGGSFFTLWDESYCLLKCRDAYEHIITGKTQWDLIAIQWFPYFDLTSKVQASWASFILIVATAINATIVSCHIFGKKSILRCFSVFLLLLLPTIGGEYASEIQNRMGWVTGINYLVMQVFMLGSSLSYFLLYYYAEKPILRLLSITLTGIFVGLSVFVILPSGCLLLFGYIILMIVLNRKDRKQLLGGLLGGLLGVVIAICYMHVFVANVSEIMNEMAFTSSYVVKSGAGYTPLSFLKMIGRLLLCYVFIIPFIYGSFKLSEANNGIRKNIGWVVYLLLLTVATVLIYQKTKYLPTTLLFVSIILPLVFSIRNHILQGNDKLLIAFLLLFPLIGAVGTNTSLLGRIGSFIFAWGFLWMVFEEKMEIKNFWYVTLGAILIVLIPVSYNSARIYYHHKEYNTERFIHGSTGVAELSLTHQQLAYFENIFSIISQYGFEPQKSVMFTSYTDYCTIYAFDAVLSSRFHLPHNYPFFPKEQMMEPDFIILNEEEVLYYHLSDMSWGWPEMFDSYEIGTPETICQKFIGDYAKNRILYCRKSLKQLGK